MGEEIVKHIRSLLPVEGEAGDSRSLSLFLSEVRAEDLAGVMFEFKPDEQAEIFRHLDDRTTAEVLQETDPQTMEDALRNMEAGAVANILELMAPDAGADLVGALAPKQRVRVLERIQPSSRLELVKLLRYEPDSAGGIMTPHTAEVLEGATAGEALRMLQGRRKLEFIGYVYVVDENRALKGVVSLKDILRAAPVTPVCNFMETDLITVEVNTDQEHVARVAERYNLKAVPVVENGILRGIVTLDDVMSVLVDEASEDIYRFSGSAEEHPAKETVARRFLMRIPWLGVPLAGGMLVALVQSEFEQVFPEELLLLMLFTPAVIGMSGGVGLQSSAVMLRGLATGEIEAKRALPVALKEVFVGLLIGLACGAVSACVVWFILASGIVSEPLASPLRVASAVAGGLIVGMAIGAVTGTFIPLLCQYMGVDPAFVAGPFTTTMNDILGASVYIFTAVLIL